MINSELPPVQDTGAAHLATNGPLGAAVLAGAATAIVLAIWVCFYFLVFTPRSVP
jgi:hypothetical protein